MRRIMFASLMMLVPACSRLDKAPTVRPSGEGICAGLEAPARAHAAALAQSQDDASVVTGDRLISGLIAACGYEAGAQG